VNGVGLGLDNRISSAAARLLRAVRLSSFTTEREIPAMGPRPEISAALLKAAHEISQPRELQTTLDTIVETAAHSLPGIDHVGITIASSSGALETKAGSDTFVWELDKLQYELHEGPCLHAIAIEPV